MREYELFSDSTTDLPHELCEKLGIKIVPLTFTIDNKEYFNYLDGSSMSPKRFYTLMREGKTPSTSQINSYRFKEYFTPILEQGKDILFLAFSGVLSGTCSQAQAAAASLHERYPSRKIVVVDTLCASLGEGLLVYLTAQKKLAGASIEEAADFAEKTKLSVCHWFTVGDLKYLKNGGRLSATAAFFGTLINIKPVMHVDNDGRLVPVVKCRGRKKSLEVMADKIEQYAEHIKEQTVFLIGADCAEEINQFAESLKTRYGIKEIITNDIGPVVGSHAGPGTIALFFLGKER